MATIQHKAPNLLATPQPLDARRPLQLRHLAEDAVLRGSPAGEEHCSNCVYYSDDAQAISYCRHRKLSILVGENWWCQWWQSADE